MLAGVMWEEHRPVDRIEVGFAGAAPDPAHLALDVTTNTPTDTQDNRPTWWTRKPEPFPGSASIRGDGRVMDYHTDIEAITRSLEGYPNGFRYEPDPGGMVLVDTVRLRYTGDEAWPVVTSLRVFGSARVSPAVVTIEWGIRPGDETTDFSGSFGIYNGRIARVEPLHGSIGVAMTGPLAWRSPPTAGRRGVVVELGYVADDMQEVRFTPATFLPVGGDGSLRCHPNRTVVTVRTAGGTFSFAPRDLEAGPIIVPGTGFAVARAGEDASRRLPLRANPAHGTVRRRVRALPEQSFAQALADHYGVDRPPMPEPEVEAPMRIDVPDAFAEAAWRVAYWHVRRRCLPSDDGIPQIVIWPYKALLGQESWRIFVALDLLGEHGVTRSGFEPWFRAQGTVVARGCFDGPEGALNVPGWDLNHSQGHGSMLYAMAEHHLLSGDDAWLAEHRTGLTYACEWIARQRRRWTGLVGQDSWSAGLMPPGEFGDYADWRSLYQTNVVHWRALKTAARSLQAIDTTAARRWTDEADDFLCAIRSAAARSADLAPVVRVLDGTYRRYIPPHPWLRGRCDLIANPYSGGHAGTLVMDSDCGAVALGLGALPDDDPLMDEYLDVLEDDLYLDNWMVRMHARERRLGDPQGWFSVGGYYYQCGYSQSALVHLRRDDIPAYLRSMINQYAVDVDPDHGYQFREHPHRTGEGNGGDKTFEAAAFLERMRAMFVMEDGDRLWLARGTPRDWLARDGRIAVHGAPSQFGTVAYEIVSDVEHAVISATVELPSRARPREVALRLRHPRSALMISVSVDGRPWKKFSPQHDIVRLDGLGGTVRVQARFRRPLPRAASEEAQ